MYGLHGCWLQKTRWAGDRFSGTDCKWWSRCADQVCCRGQTWAWQIRASENQISCILREVHRCRKSCSVLQYWFSQACSIRRMSRAQWQRNRFWSKSWLLDILNLSVRNTCSKEVLDGLANTACALASTAYLQICSCWILLPFRMDLPCHYPGPCVEKIRTSTGGSSICPGYFQ